MRDNVVVARVTLTLRLFRLPKEEREAFTSNVLGLLKHCNLSLWTGLDMAICYLWGNAKLQTMFSATRYALTFWECKCCSSCWQWVQDACMHGLRHIRQAKPTSLCTSEVLTVTRGSEAACVWSESEPLIQPLIHVESKFWHSQYPWKNNAIN